MDEKDIGKEDQTVFSNFGEQRDGENEVNERYGGKADTSSMEDEREYGVERIGPGVLSDNSNDKPMAGHSTAKDDAFHSKIERIRENILSG